MTAKKNKKNLQGLPTVVLVGRVNVGKSTLFNRLLGEKKALVSPIAGTTRDVNYGVCSWRDRQILLADTGGFIFHPKSEIEKAIFSHAEAAIRKATMILFIVDLHDGLRPDDRDYIRLIRRFTKVPLLLVGNKADTMRDRIGTHEPEWLALSLGTPIPVSAISGSGTGDLLDIILPLLPKATPPEEEAKKRIKVAIIGRTNVGKSSLVNRVLGEERVIVSAMPHTTREPHDTLIQYQDASILLIDTVGIRRKTRVASTVERDGVKRSIDNIKKSDVVLFVLESTVTPSKQEKRLIDICVQAGSSVCIIVNKWDLVAEKQSKTVLAYEDLFRNYFPFLSWAPIVFLSALTGQRIHTILDIVITLYEERSKIIPEDKLRDFLYKARTKQPPQWLRGQKKPYINELVQKKANPPTFELLVRERFSIPTAYLRYLENRIREQFGFDGTPIRIYTAESEEEYFGKKKQK